MDLGRNVMRKNIITPALLLLLVACGGAEESKPDPAAAAGPPAVRTDGSGAQAYQDAILARRLRAQAGLADPAQVTYGHVSESPSERARRRMMEFHAERRASPTGEQSSRPAE